MCIRDRFYGLRATAAPLALWDIARDLVAAPALAGVALAWQSVLTIVQWGAHQMAVTRDRRWWLLWLAALGLSAAYNLTAFYVPGVALGIPPVLLVILIIGGDAVPELVAVRR